MALYDANGGLSGILSGIQVDPRNPTGPQTVQMDPRNITGPRVASVPQPVPSPASAPAVPPVAPVSQPVNNGLADFSPELNTAGIPEIAPVPQTGTDDAFINALGQDDKAAGAYFRQQKADYDKRRNELETQRRTLSEQAAASESAALESATGLISEHQKQLDSLSVPERPSIPRPGNLELPEAPSMAMRPFGSSPAKPGEPVFDSLNRTLALLGLVGSMGVGVTSGYAEGALASYTGALKGWAEGDAIRAQNDWKDYNAKINRMKFNHDQLLSEWEDAWKIYGYDQDTLKTKLGIIAAQHSLDPDKIKLAFREPERLRTLLDQTTKNLEQLDKDRTAQNTKLFDTYWDNKTKLEAAKLRAQEKAEASNLTDAALDNAATYLNQTGNVPPGLSRNIQMQTKILNRASELRTADTPSQAEAAANYKSNLAELNKLKTQRGPILAFASTADHNLDIALEKSRTVNRTGVPAFNRWILAGRQDVTGDPEVSALNAAIRVAINETAKVTSGATGGAVTSDAARKEIEAMLNSAQTPQQFEAVVGVLRRDMGNRITGYNEQISAAERRIRGGEQSQTPTAAPSAPTNTDTARRSAVDPSGKPYSLPANTDLSKYPGWKWK